MRRFGMRFSRSPTVFRKATCISCQPILLQTTTITCTAFGRFPSPLSIQDCVGARRAVPLLIACALAFILVACSPASNEKGKGQVTLHLFTWSDYTDETAVKQFEERLG